MNDQIFWIIFWSIILVCIVAITVFVVITLFQFSQDLKRLRTTIDNTNQISTNIVDVSNHIAEGTQSTSNFIKSFTNTFSLYKIYNSIFKKKKR